jgi:hypothetical protein
MQLVAEVAAVPERLCAQMHWRLALAAVALAAAAAAAAAVVALVVAALREEPLVLS